MNKIASSILLAAVITSTASANFSSDFARAYRGSPQQQIAPPAPPAPAPTPRQIQLIFFASFQSWLRAMYGF
jgi:hypothetical protein